MKIKCFEDLSLGFEGSCAIKQEPAKLRKWRTIEECYREIKRLDPESAITYYFIRTQCKTGKVICTNAGKKILVDLDSLLDVLNKRGN